MGTAGISRSAARILMAACAAVAAVAVLGAQPARAAEPTLLGCGYSPVHPFLGFLDPLPYTLVPGADFESGAQGWKLSGGARVVSGNEPWFVTGAGHSRSLLLPAGSSATSPPMCMGLVLPVVRFFSTGGVLLSYMQVEALYTDTAGRQKSIVLLPVGLPSKTWIPNLPMLQLGGALNTLTLNGLTSEISLRFTPRGLLFGSGTWQVDDVYVDPWKNI
jgi:hypothetical protein